MHDQWQPPNFQQGPSYPGTTPFQPTPPPPGEEDSFNPEDINALARYGVTLDEMLENAMREQRGYEAAQAGPSEGRQVGGVYVAASPFEQAAKLGQRAGGLYQQKKAEEERRKLRQDLFTSARAPYNMMDF